MWGAHRGEEEENRGRGASGPSGLEQQRGTLASFWRQESLSTKEREDLVGVARDTSWLVDVASACVPPWQKGQGWLWGPSH